MRLPNRLAFGGGVLYSFMVLGTYAFSFPQMPAQQNAQANSAAQVLRSSSMIGKPAQLKSGASIGAVKDLVLGNDATIDFVVLASQQELILVPFNLVEVDEGNRVIFIAVIPERFREFRRIADLSEVRALSRLFTIPVNLRSGGTLGLISDLVFANNGRIDFLTLALGDRLIAVPFSLARLDFLRQFVSIDATRADLLRAPSFARNQFPNLSMNSQMAQQVNTFFHQQTGAMGRTMMPSSTVRPIETRQTEARPMEKTMPGARPTDRSVPTTRPAEKEMPGNQPVPPVPRPAPPMPRPAPKPMPRTPG
jgi:hypothetical protein